MKAARNSVRTTGRLSRAPIADIVEEHLDEAAFYLERWDRALTSPHHTLAQLRDGPEEAMLAHVDGLAVGGESAAKQLLWPVVEDDEADDWARVGAAALALLTMPGQDFSGRLLARLPAAPSGTYGNRARLGDCFAAGTRPAIARGRTISHKRPAYGRTGREQGESRAAGPAVPARRSAGYNAQQPDGDPIREGPNSVRANRGASHASLCAGCALGRGRDRAALGAACGAGGLRRDGGAHEPNAMLLSALLGRPGFEKPIYEALGDAEGTRQRPVGSGFCRNRGRGGPGPAAHG